MRRWQNMGVLTLVVGGITPPLIVPGSITATTYLISVFKVVSRVFSANKGFGDIMYSPVYLIRTFILRILYRLIKKQKNMVFIKSLSLFIHIAS
jgi:hypothetical protein